MSPRMPDPEMPSSLAQYVSEYAPQLSKKDLPSDTSPFYVDTEAFKGVHTAFNHDLAEQQAADTASSTASALFERAEPDIIISPAADDRAPDAFVALATSAGHGLVADTATNASRVAGDLIGDSATQAFPEVVSAAVDHAAKEAMAATSDVVSAMLPQLADRVEQQATYVAGNVAHGVLVDALPDLAAGAVHDASPIVDDAVQTAFDQQAGVSDSADSAIPHMDMSKPALETDTGRAINDVLGITSRVDIHHAPSSAATRLPDAAKFIDIDGAVPDLCDMASELSAKAINIPAVDEGSSALGKLWEGAKQTGKSVVSAAKHDAGDDTVLSEGPDTVFELTAAPGAETISDSPRISFDAAQDASVMGEDLVTASPPASMPLTMGGSVGSQASSWHDWTDWATRRAYSAYHTASKWASSAVDWAGEHQLETAAIGLGIGIAGWYAYSQYKKKPKSDEEEQFQNSASGIRGATRRWSLGRDTANRWPRHGKSHRQVHV